ncbi:MAG: hypothetical protein LKI24_13300 [Acidipropionibacterium sp.]|nr:hypothetical protein [Acidipropionibacterium sp.]
MAMQLRLSPEEDKMLTAIAQDDDQSKTTTLALLVRAEWNRRQSRHFTHSVLDDLTAKRSDLLDRLAE